MDALKKSVESQGSAVMERAEAGQIRVFQPQSLKEIVDIIDLTGNVATRVREDKSRDLGSGGAGSAAATGTGQTGSTARDQAIANVPVPQVMRQKLVSHLEKELVTVEQQARKLSRSGKKGSAYMLSELYKKIHRLTSLIADLLEASAVVIKRFYISVFIDRQPLVVTGGSLVQSEE